MRSFRFISNNYITEWTIATVSKSRLFKRAGILSEKDMNKVEEAVKILLGIF
jgi:mRNA-degrading endonuclease toxin of MazEF toxin-antitoxin module